MFSTIVDANLSSGVDIIIFSSRICTVGDFVFRYAAIADTRLIGVCGKHDLSFCKSLHLDKKGKTSTIGRSESSG
jgi:hypothetical protein